MKIQKRTKSEKIIEGILPQGEAARSGFPFLDES